MATRLPSTRVAVCPFRAAGVLPAGVNCSHFRVSKSKACRSPSGSLSCPTPPKTSISSAPSASLSRGTSVALCCVRAAGATESYTTCDQRGVEPAPEPRWSRCMSESLVRLPDSPPYTHAVRCDWITMLAPRRADGATPITPVRSTHSLVCTFSIHRSFVAPTELSRPPKSHTYAPRAADSATVYCMTDEARARPGGTSVCSCGTNCMYRSLKPRTQGVVIAMMHTLIMSQLALGRDPPY
eukprot:6204764-Pleurochrysis_carterae.AAC.5